MSSDKTNSKRDYVNDCYKTAQSKNKTELYDELHNATTEYTYENQKIDAHRIIHKFYTDKCKFVSVSKKTKVGMDGLIIEVITKITTHPDENFIVDYKNVRIITGMNNTSWEKNLKNKIPACFEKNVFHHGQLQHANLKGLKNGLIIIDEIDCGGKEDQKLHKKLRESNILNLDNIEKNNIKFIVTSATMIIELRKLSEWKENLHGHIQMTIPENYLSHKYMLDKGIIKEFFLLNSKENVEKWIKEDIIDRYDNDYRIHIVRLNTRPNSKTITLIMECCDTNNIDFYDYSTDGDITEQGIENLFNEPINNHIVLGIKGFFRRANLIPNKWKLKIGATHELCTNKVDFSVQIQGLSGRMTGYWKHIINDGFKTGPHRTSIEAIECYELAYNNPFENYETNNKRPFVDKKNVEETENNSKTVVNNDLDKTKYKVFDNIQDAIKWVNFTNKDKFKKTISKNGRDSPNYKSPKHLLINDKNPPVEHIIKLCWAIKKGEYMKPLVTKTDKNQFCVYWRGENII